MRRAVIARGRGCGEGWQGDPRDGAAPGPGEVPGAGEDPRGHRRRGAGADGSPPRAPPENNRQLRGGRRQTAEKGQPATDPEADVHVVEAGKQPSGAPHRAPGHPPGHTHDVDPREH